MHSQANFTCFLIVLSKIAGAFSLVKTVTRGSLLAKTNSTMEDLSNLPSAEIRNGYKIMAFLFFRH